MSANEPLIVKYRPRHFDEVIGHEEAMRALQRRLQDASRPHAYLLTGTSGVGKTTIARLIAAYLKCEIVEIDAATYSGVDAMRELMDTAAHRSLGASGSRIFLFNEVQRLSRGAFDAMLTTLEEPPEHLYFALTTTELPKVPDAVVTRCYHLDLRPLRDPQIETLIEAVCYAEGWEVSGDIVNAVLRAANGSPRQAITVLEAVHDAETPEEIHRILSITDDSSPLIKLCQLLLAGNRNWAQIGPQLARLDDENIANSDVAAARYIMAAMVRSKDEKSARYAWQLLDALLFPAQSFDKKALLYAAIGRMMWS